MQISTDYAQTEREEGPDLATGATPFNYGTDAGKWACPTCTYENEDSLDCCDMCMFNRIVAQTAAVAAITATTAAAAADDDAQEHAEAETPRSKHHDDQELARRMALGLRVQRPETLHTTGYPLFAAVDAAGTSAGAVEEGVLDAFENVDPGSGCNEWLAAGSRFIGKRILRKAVNEKGVAWEMTGRVVGWLPPESTETIDGNALYHCVHNDGDEVRMNVEPHVMRPRTLLKPYDQFCAPLLRRICTRTKFSNRSNCGNKGTKT
jgi:Ni/Co efflux regulator RcnB